MYCTRLRAHHRQPPGSPGRPQSGYFDGGPLACTSYAPQALEKMGCGQHQHLSTRTRELRAGGGLVSSWVAAAAAAAAAAVLCLQLAGLAAALLQLPLCPVAAGCWCVAVAAAASASAASAAAASAASAAAASAASAASAPAVASPSSCCLSFFLLPLLHCRPPCSRCSSLHLLLIWCCWWAGKGSLSANRQQCPRTAALLGFWRFVSARLGPKRQEGE